MPRSARVVVPAYPHHVTQRGNNRQDVFFVDDDRRTFIDLLRESCGRFGMRLEAYCLMTNHVHLVTIPAREDSLGLAFKWVNQIYAQYINDLHDRSGHLWEDRFFSCPLDDPHYWRAMAYVERNPVRAGIVPNAWAYSWSSAAAHCGEQDKSGLLDMRAWTGEMGPGVGVNTDDWKEVLTRPEDEIVIARLRSSTRRGRPLGSDSFISKLESLVGRRLRAQPRGRPLQENDVDRVE
jgi:putative transposase